MENFYLREKRKPGLWAAGLISLTLWCAFAAVLLAIAILLTGCTTEGKFVRPIQSAPIIVPQPDGTAKTNEVSFVAPEWIAAMETAKQGSGLLPPPFDAWAGLGVGALGAILAAIARNKQKSAEGIAESVIRGIEAAGSDPAVLHVKENVSAVSRIKGNSAEVHNKVKQLTK